MAPSEGGTAGGTVAVSLPSPLAAGGGKVGVWGTGVGSDTGRSPQETKGQTITVFEVYPSSQLKASGEWLLPRARDAMPAPRITAILDGNHSTEADREPLVQADHDVFGGEAKAARGLVRFLQECDDFTVEEATSAATPMPSTN